ncbi:hypothetical protein HID58_052399, partial [Brassica napus]
SRPKSNTDCLHVQASAGVTITDNTFQSGDHRESKLNFGPGHGISIGSLGKDTNEVGEHNITLVSSVFFPEPGHEKLLVSDLCRSEILSDSSRLS